MVRFSHGFSQVGSAPQHQTVTDNLQRFIQKCMNACDYLSLTYDNQFQRQTFVLTSADVPENVMAAFRCVFTMRQNKQPFTFFKRLKAGCGKSDLLRCGPRSSAVVSSCWWCRRARGWFTGSIMGLSLLFKASTLAFMLLGLSCCFAKSSGLVEVSSFYIILDVFPVAFISAA